MLNLDGTFKKESTESYTQAHDEFYRRFFDLSRSTEPVDRELMESHVRSLYKWLDKSAPNIVWCDSPLQVFAIPYLIDYFSNSGDPNWEKLWPIAEERYFSNLPASVLVNLELGKIKERLCTLNLDSRCGYRLQDAIDINRVLELQLREKHKRFKNRSTTSYHNRLPDLQPPNDQTLEDNYNAFNYRLFRDFNIPVFVQYALDSHSSSDWDLDWYQPGMPYQHIHGNVESCLWLEWRGTGRTGQRPGLNREAWYCFLPEYAELNGKGGLGSQVNRYWGFSSTKWPFFDKHLVMPTLLWAELLMQLRYIVCFEHTVFLSERPTIWTFDASDRLHGQVGPAIKFKDGYGHYFWRGLSVESKIIEDEPTVEQIEKEDNVEIRRVLIERFGVQQYLLASRATAIQSDERGTLYRKELVRDEPLQMVHVINKTAEPDGTFKDYFLRVPPTVQTAREAIAWSFQMDAEDYNPTQES